MILVTPQYIDQLTNRRSWLLHNILINKPTCGYAKGICKKGFEMLTKAHNGGDEEDTSHPKAAESKIYQGAGTNIK